MMTKEELVKDIKHYTGVVLNADELFDNDIENYEKSIDKSYNYWNEKIKDSEPEFYNLLIDRILNDKYNYLQERYNM